MTWLGCQTAIPLPTPPPVAAPPDARQRHRLVGRALPESHWNIGNTGPSHQHASVFRIIPMSLRDNNIQPTASHDQVAYFRLVRPYCR
jgi:hypothetical protein